MNLSYPTLPRAITVQAWGNVNPRLYPAPNFRHMGIDIGGLSVGAPIYAVCDGFVTEINLTGAHGYGRHVVLQHDGFTTLYAHLHKVQVTLGQTLKAGMQIGEMGGDPNDDDPIDGASGGTHLHMEVILPNAPSGDCVKTVLGYTVDPFAYLLQRYGEMPLYEARVVEARGVRVRLQANTAKDTAILYALQKNQTMKVVEITADDDRPWVRFLALRPEWAAVTDQGAKLLELTPLSPSRVTAPPIGEAANLGGENAARLDEVERMMAALQARAKELE